jgi:chemotaxis protein CheY-P-specific phosphatase CheC
MPRVLLPGEPDSTAFQEKQEALNAFQETIKIVMGRHHTAFLNMFEHMMIGAFVPGMEKMLNRVSPHTSSTEVGETSSAQPASAQPPLQGQPIQPPPQSTGSQPV